MRITVINGSPKACDSITVHSLYYLERLFPEDSFKYIDAGKRIKAYTKDFSMIKDDIECADLIVFSYPVYTFIAPAQLHFFMSLLKENGINLKGRFCTQITTSKHFYDVTAHKYIEENVGDLGMRYIKGLSADMEDLLTEKGRKELVDWYRLVKWSMKEGMYQRQVRFQSSYSPLSADVPEIVRKDRKGDIVIVSDHESSSDNLYRMVKRFEAVSDRNVRIIKLKDIPLRGGCLGCFHCASTGKCVYTDGYDDYLRQEIQSAECILYAFRIKDHSMGPQFKMFDDRQFCNGHRTVTMGSPVGYIISGPYSQEINLKTIIEARAEVGGNILAGVATDELDPNADIDMLSRSVSYLLDHKVSKPQNFYGVGGMKIFRDLIYTMRGMMKADHRFFKSHGQYDFPQKRRGTIFKMYLVGALMSNQAIMKKAGGKVTEGMVGPYKKVVESIEAPFGDKITVEKEKAMLH